MTHSAADVVRAALVARGIGTLPVGTNPNWPVFVGHMPEAPDNAVCVYDTPGDTQGRIMRTGESIIRPGWQIRVRATNHQTAFAKITAIQAVVDGIRNFGVVIEATRYTIDSLRQMGGVMALGQEPEAKRRNGFTLNGTITHREVPR